MGEMKIQKLNKENISEVATLLRNYWKERNMDYSPKWTENYLKKGHSTEIKKEQFFITKKENKAIGVISVILWEGDLAELRDFVIKKELRGKGYGKRLLEFALNWCKKNNTRKIMALIFPKYKGLFKKYDFKQEGYLKDHFKKGEDLIFMSKIVQ